MTTATRDRRAVTTKVHLLRIERAEWLANRRGPFAYWGVPYCGDGKNCEGAACLGCHVADYCKDMAATLSRRISDLLQPPAEALEGELFSRVGNEWVMR